MSDTFVHRDIVLKVLKASGVDVSRGKGDLFTLAKKDVSIETIVIPLRVERKMLFRFQYRYKAYIHWFFHPEMIPGEQEGPVQ